MTRRAGFALVAGPALAWIPVSVWVHAHLDEWIASKEILPLPVRLALYVDNHVVRLFPLVVLAILLVMPLLVWGASRLQAPSGNARSVATWLLLSVGLELAALVAYRSAPLAWVLAAVLEIWWAGIIAYVLSLGAAVAVQRDRWTAGRTSWRPRTVLWLGWLGTFVGGLGFLVPALVWLGAHRDRRRVEVTRS